MVPFLWVMGLRLLGLFRFGMPLPPPPDPASSGRGGLLGACLLGLPFGLAGCPTCALILPSVLTATAASSSPLIGALAMSALGLGQGVVLVMTGTYVGGLAKLKSLASYRIAVEKLLGIALLLAATYFTWRALL